MIKKSDHPVNPEAPEGIRVKNASQKARPKKNKKILVLRPNSGISGDILVAGLALMNDLDQKGLSQLVNSLGLPELKDRITLEPKSYEGIFGFGLKVDLAKEEVHRTLSDILELLERAEISLEAKLLAQSSFRLLAQAEARVHGLSPEEIHFHEVGALDSILDMGLASILFDCLKPDLFISGPLPICDGSIKCAHGLLSSPAPAVSILLEGTTVTGLKSTGETVTPTGLALLKSFGVKFGLWPEMVIERSGLIFGSRFLPGVPNGALFALGHSI